MIAQLLPTILSIYFLSAIACTLGCIFYFVFRLKKSLEPPCVSNENPATSISFDNYYKIKVYDIATNEELFSENYCLNYEVENNYIKVKCKKYDGFSYPYSAATIEKYYFFQNKEIFVEVSSA